MNGQKFDSGKLRWSLIPDNTLIEMIKVLEFGATKYGEDNWKLVPESHRRYYDAAMRHIESYWNGEAADQETGLSHLAHAMCCLTFLMWLEQNK